MKIDIKKVLDLQIEDCDIGPCTVRKYLKELLLQLWDKEEGFSGKRPFGNSGWQCDFYKPLIEANLVSGKLDSDGYIEEIDKEKVHKLIREAIESLE